MPKKSLTSQEWTKIYNGLGLGKETTSQLQAFRARHTSALNKNSALKSTVPEIDISHYKSILKDQSAVQNAEKVLREFKPVDYDLSKWNGVVDAFEGKAVAAAKETLAKISKEEGSLKETLSNIQEARPFEDLTVSHFPHVHCLVSGQAQMLNGGTELRVEIYRDLQWQRSISRCPLVLIYSTNTGLPDTS
jgi:F-type H+-transporting ATPase subunit d